MKLHKVVDSQSWWKKFLIAFSVTIFLIGIVLLIIWLAFPKQKDDDEDIQMVELPVTNDFYAMNDTILNNGQPAITGFAPAFLDSMENEVTLDRYLAEHGGEGANEFDLSNQYIVSPGASIGAFSLGRYSNANINRFFHRLYRVDLRYTKFVGLVHSNYVSAANFTFSGSGNTLTDFSNVRQLALDEADFSYYTYTDLTAGFPIDTACSTFANVDFSHLKVLEFNDAKFFDNAVFLNSGTLHGVPSNVSIGDNTFAGCKFSDLREIKFDFELISGAFPLDDYTNSIELLFNFFFGAEFDRLTQINYDFLFLGATNINDNYKISTDEITVYCGNDFWSNANLPQLNYIDVLGLDFFDGDLSAYPYLKFSYLHNQFANTTYPSAGTFNCGFNSLNEYINYITNNFANLSPKSNAGYNLGLTEWLYVRQTSGTFSGQVITGAPQPTDAGYLNAIFLQFLVGSMNPNWSIKNYYWVTNSPLNISGFISGYKRSTPPPLYDLSGGWYCLINNDISTLENPKGVIVIYAGNNELTGSSGTVIFEGCLYNWKTNEPNRRVLIEFNWTK